MLRPSRRGGRSRFLYWQVGLFFLGAGVWLGGVLTGRTAVTGVAIAILVAAMILGAMGRRGQQDE